MQFARRYFLLEIGGVILAATVLILIHNTYENFSRTELLNSNLILSQQVVNDELFSVHLMFHEEPEDHEQRLAWQKAIERKFEDLRQQHQQLLSNLQDQPSAYNVELHRAVARGLSGLQYWGEQLLRLEESPVPAKALEESFDNAFYYTVGLLKQCEVDLQVVMNDGRVQIQNSADELKAAVLSLFVIMLALLALYQQRMRRLHERLRENIRASQAVTENLIDGVLTMDSEGTILSVNPAIEKILGYTLDELSGRSIEVLMPPDHEGKHDRYVKNFLNTGVRKIIGVGREVNARCKDGRLVPIYLGVSEYTVKGQRCFAGVMRDISRAKSQEKELLQAKEQAEAGSRAKSEFLSAMTHEVRTPLNGIMGALSLLRMESVGKQQEYINLAHESAEDLLKLLEAVLEYSRMDEGLMELQPVDLAINHLCDDLFTAHAPAGRKKNLSMNCEVAPGTPALVRVDVLRLRQILDHLLANAIKFTNQGGYSLRVSSHRRGKETRLCFEVRDSGEGVAREHQDEIFLAFKQVDGSLTRRHGGMGLGLAICSRLAKALGGGLSLESDLGKGSCFCLEVPVEVVDQSGFDVPPIAHSA